MNNAINALYRALKDNLSIYVYKDDYIDIAGQYILTPKSNLTGIETTFQVNGLDTSVTKDFVLNRYLVYNNVERRIVNYIPLTNSITIAQSFGVPITTTDEIKLIVKENLFIDVLDSFEMNGSQLWNKSINILFSLHLKTKKDYTTDKINDFFDNFKDLLNSVYRKRIPYIDNSGMLTVNPDIIKSDISSINQTDITNGYKEFLINFSAIYSKKY